MAKKIIEKKTKLKRNKIPKKSNSNIKNSKFKYYNKNKKYIYKKQKKTQTHCHLCHNLISRTHYHSHIKNNHNFCCIINSNEKNHTINSCSSRSLRYKELCTGKTPRQIYKLKTTKKNIKFKKISSSNISSSSSLSFDKKCGNNLYEEENKWPLFEEIFKDKNLNSAIIYTKKNRKNFIYYEFKEIKNIYGNLKTKYEIPEYIREMPKNFSLFATMQEFAFIKNLIKNNLYDYILNELEEIKNNNSNCFAIELIDKENLNWKATINICCKDKKINKSVNIHINFPKTYPFDAPIIKVSSSITNNKLISNSGRVLLDTINKWNSSQSIIDVLREIKEIFLKLKNYSVINNENKNNSFPKIMNKKDEIINFIFNKKKNKEKLNKFSNEEDTNQNKDYDIKNNIFEPIPKNNYCYICKKNFYNYLEHIKSEDHLNSIDLKSVKRLKESFSIIVFNKNKREKNNNKYSLSNLSNFSETPSYLIFSDK